MRLADRRRGLLVAAAIALASGVGCSKDVAANDLEAGDCVLDEEALDRADIETVDCGEEHVFELIGASDLDVEDEYPGRTELASTGQERCQGQLFEDYVGVPFVESADVFVTAIPPTEETWNDADDRTILCFAHTEDRTATTGSVEGSEG